jgi:hypothetical protein
MPRSIPWTGTPTISLVAAGAAVLLALGSGQGATQPSDAPAADMVVCSNPAPIPGGFDYPQTSATIESWVAARDTSRARAHGWYLWAGLNSVSSGTPVWRSWCTSTQAFAAPGLTATQAVARMGHQRELSLNALRRADSPAPARRVGAAASGEDPINFPNAPYYPVPAAVQRAYPQCYDVQRGQLVDGPTFQNNGDIMVAGVIYDSSAYGWIRNQRLYDGNVLTRQIPPANRRAAVAAFPSTSIALKPMMWPVRGDGYTALPVWDDRSSDGGSYAGFEIQSMWPRAVAVTAQPASTIATVDVTYLHGVYNHAPPNAAPLGPNRYRGARVVPVSDFYTFRFPNLAAMAPCDRAILDASAYWAYGRAFAPNDYLVVVAMHIMTREQAGWTFQSVWWSDHPDTGPYAADRPAIPASQAPGPWRHYLLTSTYGITAQPGGTTWPVAYNPYIELAAAHPIRTNCTNCHHRAAWPPAPTGPQTISFPSASYEAQGPRYPNAPDALDVFTQANAIFNQLVTVDALWSIADRAAPAPASATMTRRH